MAIYEYSCQQCGQQFQARRSMKDADSPIDCPKCGNPKAKRGLSLFFAANGSSSIKGASGSSSCGSCSSNSCSSCSSGH